MAVTVHIDLISHTFRGRAACQQRSAWPPSPARLVGALLAGAHTLPGADPDSPSGQCQAARKALSTLTAAPLPMIVTPAPPVEMADNDLTWYAPDHPVGNLFEKPKKNTSSGQVSVTDDGRKSAKVLRKVVSPPTGMDASNKQPKTRTVSQLPLGTRVTYVIAAEIADGEQLDALRAAAQAVPYFGASCDHAVVTVGRDDCTVDELQENLRDGEQVWVAATGRGRSGSTIRGWSAATVEFFDDIHRDGGTPAAADARVPETRYVRYRGKISEDPRHENLLILPFSGGVKSLRQFAVIAAGLDTDEHVLVLPALDRNRGDRVRGAILVGPGRHEVADRYADVFALDNDVLSTGMNPPTWVGPSERWESVTPIAGHPDSFIARGEIELDLREQGLQLVAMTGGGWRKWHTTRLDLLVQYGRWFVTARTLDGQPISGPIRIGACETAGAGLLAPPPARRTT